MKQFDIYIYRLRILVLFYQFIIAASGLVVTDAELIIVVVVGLKQYNYPANGSWVVYTEWSVLCFLVRMLVVMDDAVALIRY